MKYKREKVFKLRKERSEYKEKNEPEQQQEIVLSINQFL